MNYPVIGIWNGSYPLANNQVECFICFTLSFHGHFIQMQRPNQNLKVWDTIASKRKQSRSIRMLGLL